MWIFLFVHPSADAPDMDGHGQHDSCSCPKIIAGIYHGLLIYAKFDVQLIMLMHTL